MASEGGLPAFDNMRYVPLEVEFSKEILPNAIVFLHKTFNVFGEYSIPYVAVISPVIFYCLGLILFFLLVWSLTVGVMLE